MKRKCLLIVTVLFIMSSLAFAGREKIAVAANGETPEASVSSRPGLAPFILFFDAEGKFMEAVPNPGNNGIVVAGFLAKRGVTIIVAEGFGPIIVEIMKGEGIKPVAFTGTAEVAVKAVLRAK